MSSQLRWHIDKEKFFHGPVQWLYLLRKLWSWKCSLVWQRKGVDFSKRIPGFILVLLLSSVILSKSVHPSEPQLLHMWNQNHAHVLGRLSKTLLLRAGNRVGSEKCRFYYLAMYFSAVSVGLIQHSAFKHYKLIRL